MIRTFIQKLFCVDVYIKIHENKLEVKDISSGGDWVCAYPDRPYTTERLLVGTFSAAEPALRKAIKSVQPNRFKAVRAVVHPLERIEGGLCEIEERVFKELAEGAGAFSVVLHIGAELSSSEAASLMASVQK